METLKMVLTTLLTPVASASEYISTASQSYKKEAQVSYFSHVQETLPDESKQNDEVIEKRARVISNLWNLK